MSHRVILILLLGCALQASAQVPYDRLAFFPIEPGNSWTYRVTLKAGPIVVQTFDTTMTITSTDSLVPLNGKRYWCSDFGWIRADSLGGAVYIHPSYPTCTDSTERMFVNLMLDWAQAYFMCNVGLNDVWDVASTIEPARAGKLDVVRDQKIWTAWSEYRVFADGIGLCNWNYMENGDLLIWELTQAYVGGITYTPVELVALSIVREGPAARLRWRTAAEVNNMGFDIQRRTASSAWERRGYVPAHGGEGGFSYTYLDRLPAASADGMTLLYRLRQIDIDGSEQFSEAVALHVAACPAAFELSIAPHPVTSSAMVLLRGTQANTAYRIAVYDALGREVYEMHFDGSGSGLRSLSLPTAALCSGVYFVTLSDGTDFAGTTMLVTR